MLSQLYSNVKKFAKLRTTDNLANKSKRNALDTKHLLMSALHPDTSCNDDVLHMMVFKTLSLLAMISIEHSNLEQAKEAIADLEYISRDDANTYILKLKVQILEGEQMSDLLQTVYEMQRCANFQFTHLLCTLQDLYKLQQDLNMDANVLDPLHELLLEYFSRNQSKVA